MQIKKYQAVDMQEALRQVKEEMGSEAIILSVKKIKKGSKSFGIFGRNVLEVTAAKDTGVKDQRSEDRGQGLGVRGQDESLGVRGKGLGVKDQDKLVGWRDEDNNTPLRSRASRLTENSSYASRLTEDMSQALTPIQRELEELKRLVHWLYKQNSRSLKDLKLRDLKGNLAFLYAQVRQNGVEEELAYRLLKKVKESIPDAYIKKDGYAGALVAKMMKKAIKVTGPFEWEEGKQKLVAFVGPTGAGKTTTIAKLAADSILNKGKRVSLITIDTYRIAAVEQLKIYARILGTPMDVVLSPSELKEVVKNRKDMHLILIDTAGRNQKDAVQMAELGKYFDKDKPFEIHLVLSATSKEEDMEDVIARFNNVPIHRLLFTKLDETTSFGAIFNHSVKTGIPLSYFTTGQRVPEDIEVATPERVVELILGRRGQKPL